MSLSGQALVLGVGNLLWADEGFGVRCVEAFAQAYAAHEGIAVADGGTQGLYLVDLLRTDQISIIGAVILLALMVGIIGGIVFCERAQRRIPIQYARRVVGRRAYGGGTSYFPLRLNTSGVIPPIFASSLLMLPVQGAPIP